MTIPDFSDAPTEIINDREKRDPSEYIPWTRIAEVKTPRGTRPGLMLIVRPLERIPDYRDKENDWKTLVIADIAVLDPIAPGADEYGMPLPGIPGGSQWRNQTVFPGMLNKAWRDKIGGTLIGIVYMGEAKPTPQGTMGKAPFLWRSLAQDEGAKQRGQGFMRARQEFLIPVPRDPQMSSDSWVSPSAQQPAPQASQQDPWAQPAAPQQSYATGGYVSPAPQVQQQEPWNSYPQQAQWNPQIPAGYPQQQPQYQQPAQYQYQPPVALAQPVSPAPVAQVYQQGDPWSQPAPQEVLAAQNRPAQQAAAPSAQSHQGMSTLEQLRAAQQMNAQGQPQSGEPPF